MLNKQLLNNTTVNTCFLLLVFALGSDLFLDTWPRKLFYIVFYLSLAGLFLLCQWTDLRVWYKRNKKLLLLILAIIITALSKIIWSMKFDTIQFLDIKNNYLHAGKLLFCSALIMFYFSRSEAKITKTVMCYASLMTFILVLFSLYFGYHESKHGATRIKLLADAATTTSYIIVLQAIIALSIIEFRFKHAKFYIAMMFACFSSFVIFLLMTQTRSALIVFFILSLGLFFGQFIRRSKMAAMTTVLIFTVILSGAMYKMKDRILEASEDISYLAKNDDNTSIGARLTMFKTGLAVSNSSLFGQSADERFAKASDYIHATYKESTLSIHSIHYHFHNEIIESLSLQGVVGAASLVLFYLSGLIYSLKRYTVTNLCSLLLVLALGSLGLTDVLFIQSNTAMVIGICMAIATLLRQDKTCPGSRTLADIPLNDQHK